MVGDSFIEIVFSILHAGIQIFGAVLAFCSAKDGLVAQKAINDMKSVVGEDEEVRELTYLGHVRTIDNSLKWFLIGTIMFIASFFIPILGSFVVLKMGLN